MASAVATPRRQAVWDALARPQKRNGLRHPVQSLRHAFHKHLGRRGMDPETIRVLAGHTDLKTTARHVRADSLRLRRLVRWRTGGQRGDE